jgi:hypothetical protein
MGVMRVLGVLGSHGYDDTMGPWPQCEHLPEQGTVLRERDGEPGSIMNVFDYPVRATCLHCGREIRLLHFYQGAWYVVA